MIKLENIHPLTDFKRNAKAFVDRVKATKSPTIADFIIMRYSKDTETIANHRTECSCVSEIRYILTVNGKAEVVIQDVAAFQEMPERLQQVEEELRVLKLQAIKQDLAIGAQQLER
jgi:hypothetical protein